MEAYYSLLHVIYKPFQGVNGLRKLLFSFYLNKGRVTACNWLPHVTKSKHITVDLVILMQSHIEWNYKYVSFPDLHRHKNRSLIYMSSKNRNLIYVTVKQKPEFRKYENSED